MAYGFGVFLLPLSQLIGVTKSAPCSQKMSVWHVLFTTTCDWRISDIDPIFTLFFVFLGLSAAVWGGWLERVGPRKAGGVAAVCWSSGHLIGALGIISHQLWVVWLGCGVVGGIGLGLGYISPISTLMTWFPDRRGMAAGLAVTGFGGGAMIGAPLADFLMNAFRSQTSSGVWQTFVVLAIIYCLVMGAGALGYRVPPLDWQPPGRRPVPCTQPLSVAGDVHFRKALRTMQFWLLWVVLCLSASAGIGVLGMASLMLQEVFGGKLLHLPGLNVVDLDATQRTEAAAVAAGFIGLLSMFNTAGRLVWALLSDKIGRKTTFYWMLLLGFMMYGCVPIAIHACNISAFVLLLCLIMSMFGGVFATIPAYVADIFGAKFASAIQGRILTAWATAGVLGPTLFARFRDQQLSAGMPPAMAYDVTMYVLAGLLAVGFLANMLIQPLASGQLATGRVAAQFPSRPASIYASSVSDRRGLSLDAWALTAWFFVGVPFAWGAWVTLTRVQSLFPIHG